MQELIEKVQQWASDRNLIEGSDLKSQVVKLLEEFGELAEGVGKGKPELIEDSLGDMLVVMIIIAQMSGLTLDKCLNTAYMEIKDRKGRMVEGIFIKEVDLS